MTFRAAWKLGWFGFELGIALADYFFTTALVSKKSKRIACANWLHRASRRHLKIFSCDYFSAGPIPKTGLLVTNHLSYLDILVIAAITPAIFVSKSEVRRWPIFGFCAALAGTIFIVRERRTHVGAVNEKIKSALADGALVVIFPESVSTNGEEILPFRSSLLEPVTGGADEISVGHLRYELDDGDARQEVCYWGGHTFFPHVVHLLGKKRVRAKMRFGKFQRETNDRKELAKGLREAVLKLKAED